MTKSSPFRGVTLFRPTGKWRAQISALGRTVSLGDHDTEEEAAHAFDRAAISKGGRAAKTNFPVADYEAEIAELTGLSQDELVALLRSRARKNGSHTSSYRGVSLLKQTGEWRAQISIGGKQVHLGYFAAEQLAAKAYDRAVICKGEPEGSPVATNFDAPTYKEEMEILKAMNPDDIVTALADEERRTGLLDMLARGFSVQGARGVFGSSFMRPASSRASGAQARAPKAHRELQALQKDASGNLSASTSRPGTRKRKLAEPVFAATAVVPVATAVAAESRDAVEQASTAPLQQEEPIGISDATPTEGVTAAAQPVGESHVLVNPKRRTARQNVVKSDQVQNTAGTAAAAAVGSTNSTAGETDQLTDNADRAQPQPLTPMAQTGQEQTALPKAAAVASGRTRTRAGSVTHGDTGQVPKQAAIKSEDATTLQDRRSDAEQSIAGINGEEHAESDRDKRLSARKQRAAVKPNSRLGRGADAAHPTVLSHARPDLQTSAEAPAPAANQPDANALPAEEQGPKPASRSAQHSMAPLSNVAAQVSHVQADISGSRQEAAAGPEAPDQRGYPAEIAAAEQPKATPTANGVDATALSTGAAGKTRRAKQTVALANSNSTSGAAAGTAGQAGSSPEAHPSHAPASAKAKSSALKKAPLSAAPVATRATQLAAPNSPVKSGSVPSAASPTATPASKNLLDQNISLGHLAASAPSTSPPGAVPNGPSATRPAPAAGNQLLPQGQAQLSLPESAPATAVSSGMNPASAAAQAQHDVNNASAQAGGSGGKGTGGPQGPPMPKQALAAAQTQCLRVEKADQAKFEDLTSAVQDIQPFMAQPEILPTPPASPCVVPAAPTPPTALAPTTAATAQRSTPAASPSAGAGQAPAQPFNLGQPALNLAFNASLPAMLPNASLPAPDAATVMPETVNAGQWRAASIEGGSAVDDASPRSPDFKLSARSQPSGNWSETTSPGSLPPPSKSASASSAIAAAARANAAAANAIAESGALANHSFSGAFGQLPGQLPGQPAGAQLGEPVSNSVRTFTVPANTPPAQYPSAPQAGAASASYQPLKGTMTNSLARASSNGPIMSGAFSAGRPDQFPAGQANGVSAAPSASSSLPMTQQQRLNGTAFMTAMQQSFPGVNTALGNFNGTASGPQTRFPPNSLSLGGLSQHNTASPGFASGPSPQPFLNPNFRLPSGPAPFRSSSHASLGSTSITPSFVPSSSALNPGPSGHPSGLGSQYSALGHPTAAPSPVLTKPAGSQAPGNPLSPSYRPQGLHATVLDSGDQAISNVASQGSWGQGTPPTQPQSQPQASLLAGAQVSPASSQPQPMPQLPPQTSMAPEVQSVQSRGGMTNAHAIVPGMLPSTVGRGLNTAWQVGLAAGLAATANLRPPNPALSHQAATTAAAARAAAAFQASRAFSMAKSQSQQSPLLQQGSIGTSVSGPAATAEGPNLAGPSTMPSSALTSQAPSAAASNMPWTSPDTATADGAPGNQADPSATAGAPPLTSAAVPPTTGPVGLQAGSLPIASHQAFARQPLPAASATTVATSNSATPGSMSTAATALPGRPLSTALGPISRTSAGQQMMPPSAAAYQGPTAYSAEAQALYRARAQQQPAYGAQSRPYLAQTQPGGALPPSYVSLSQPPYNVQTHTPYIAPSQVPYVPPSQAVFKHPAQSAYVPQPQPQPQSQYSTVAAAQARYATATQRYPAAAPQLAQPRPLPRPPLYVQHLNFAKLAPQPKNAIDIISEDAVLPTFPLKKKKPKKRKLAGFEVFAAEVAKHKQLALEAHSNALQCHFGKRSPIGQPHKDFRPRMPSAAQQAEQRLAKASSVTSLAVKPKGKTTKGTKGKQAATAKGTKGKKASKAADDDTPRKRNDRVNWNVAGSAKRRSLERAPSGRQFADVARLHQEAVGTSGMDQLLGALQEEFGDLESEQASDSDDGQGSGTEQAGPSRVSASGRGRGVTPVKRGKGPKTAAKPSGPGRGRGKVKGTTETAAGRVVKSRKRAASSSPDRGPPRSNRRKIQPPSREA